MLYLYRIGNLLVINSNSDHAATSTISYLGCKSISYKNLKDKNVLSNLLDELSIQRYDIMKLYEYMKYSYQKQLVGTYTLAFTSN